MQTFISGKRATRYIAKAHVMSAKPLCAVLTGDVIGSRKAGPEIWMPVLKSVLEGFGDRPNDWDIYRGDAFQLLIREPERALMVAIRIKSGFKSAQGLDARIALGVGEISYQADNVGECSGSAFIHSGALVEKLDSMHTSLALASLWPELDEELNASLALAAALMDRWLPNYAQAMAVYLANPKLTQRELGDKLGLAQNTLSERLSRAHKRELLQFEQVFRHKLKLTTQVTGNIQ